jgi:hypothetical protein
VLDAIREYHELRPEGFRERHGYGDALSYPLIVGALRRAPWSSPAPEGLS